MIGILLGPMLSGFMGRIYNMNKMHLLVIGVLIAAFSNVAMSQTAIEKESSDEVASAAEFNRQLKKLSIINNALKIDSDFQFTEDQKAKLKLLRVEHQKVVSTILEAQREGVGHNVTALEGSRFLTEELSDILLPHQELLLDQKLHVEYMRIFGGNVANLIKFGYGDLMSLSSEQKSKVDDLGEDIKAKILEAKKRFEEEIRSITEAAKPELESFLSPSQMKLIFPEMRR